MPPHSRIRFHLSLATLVALSSGIHAQSADHRPAMPFNEVGHFYMRSFAPEDYKGHKQNWAIVQDARGFIYVGNSSGVFEYDGVDWQQIYVANHTVARSLTVGPDGQIFVGAVDEIGYLAPNSQGRLDYVSLVEHIPQGDRAFSDVWQTHAVSDGVYFQSQERIFRWRDGEIKVWRSEPETGFHTGFAVHDTFYVTDDKTGELLYMDRDKLRPAPGGTRFAGQRIYALVPLEKEAFLAVTRHHGLARCSSATSGAESGAEAEASEQDLCVAYAPDLTEMLAELEPYCAVLLPSGVLAVGTRHGGLVLIGPDARLLRILGEAAGLRSEMVWAAHRDRRGGLWLGLNDGLARLEIEAPISFYDDQLGLPGGNSNAVRHRGQIYLPTGRGVYVLEPVVGEVSRFVPLPGFTEFCWSLLSTQEGLLAGCFGGVYNLDQGRKIWELSGRNVFAIYRSISDPSTLYLGLQDGFARLVLDAGEWRDGGRFESIEEEIRFVAEDDLGQLWLGTRSQGVLRVSANAATSDTQAVQRFGVSEGLPEGFLVTSTVAGQPVIHSGKGDGIFRFESGRFAPDNTLLSGLVPYSLELVEDDQGRVWIAAGETSGVVLPTPDGVDLVPTALRRDPSPAIQVMVEADGGPLWVTTADRLIRLETGAALGSTLESPVWIRSIIASDGMDLYNGPHDRPELAPTWSYSTNAMRFTFAAPLYDAPERTLYRTRLDGFDETWSDWSNETDKDYTNLWEGSYVFRVEARDVYGRISREDTFAFQISPPWYRSWWAYGLYGLALALVVLVWVRSHRGELRRARQAAARERAVSAKLREVDRLKDEFLANTSHELRTPLYGMTGLAESLVDGAAGELPAAARDHLSLLVQSGRRLSGLVDDILDFSKLENRGLELTRESVDLHALTDVVLTLMKPLASGKGLDLVNTVEASLPLVQADPHRIQQVLHNLIGNAFKYTDSGRIEVSAELGDTELRVSVRDTGIGIAEDQLERIFKPFVQTDASIRRQRGGTGLGLAISKKLITLHGGDLSVESTPGQGSAFSFTLPLATGEAFDAVMPSAEDPGPSEVSPLGVAETAASETAVSETAASEPEIIVPPDLLAGEVEKTHHLAASSALEGATILVVDDEPILRQMLENQLAPKGYQVLTAASGLEGLELLEQEMVDLVLLDIMMPRMSGYEVCRILRQDHPIEALPILFLSAMHRTEDRVAALGQGGNDYISKPVAKAELISRVSTHLEVLAAHRQRHEEVKTLRGLLPICASCKKIRDDAGLWNQIELYISKHSEAEFSHGICPACIDELYPELDKSALS